MSAKPTSLGVVIAVGYGLGAVGHTGRARRHSRSVCAESASEVLSIYDAVMLRATVFVIGVHATVLAGLLGMLWGRGWAHA